MNINNVNFGGNRNNEDGIIMIPPQQAPLGDVIEVDYGSESHHQILQEQLQLQQIKQRNNINQSEDEEDDDELECYGLFSKSDGIITRIAKIILILPFIPIYLVWKILQFLLTPIIKIYRKHIHKIIVQCCQGISNFCKQLYEKLKICCELFNQQLKKICKNFEHFIKNACIKICKCILLVCQVIGKCIISTCKLFCKCVVWFCFQIKLLFIALGKCSAYLLNLYAIFVFYVFIKCAQIRATIDKGLSFITIPLSIYILVPTLLFIFNYLLQPLMIKIAYTTKLVIYISYQHIIKPFFKVFVLNTLKLLYNFFIKFLILFVLFNIFKGIHWFVIQSCNIISIFCKCFYKHVVINFVKYVIIKFFYEIIIKTLLKIFKFIFYSFLCKIVLVKMWIGLVWLMKKLIIILKYGWKGAKFVITKTCQCLKWFFIDIIYKKVLINIYYYIIKPFFKYLFLSFKYIYIFLFKMLLKPIFQFFWKVCKAFVVGLKILFKFIYKYFVIPVWKCISSISRALKKFVSSILTAIERCFRNLGRRKRKSKR